MHRDQSRRNVIKTLLVASASSFIGDKLWTGKVVSEVKAQGFDPDMGIARLVLSSFSALSTNGGSVRLGSSNILSQGFPAGLYYPLIINRISATEYVALDSMCIHAGCVTAKFSGSVTTGRMTCNCHGSQYDIRGKCTAGPAPVGQSLTSYPTTLSNGILQIRIKTDPSWGFETMQTTVLNGTEKRLKLTWTSYNPVEYEVRFRPNLGVEPTVVPFFSTINGTTTRTFITGNDNLQNAFVVPQDGIYQVAIRLRSM
jgi:Rieske Fe-S protein